MALGTRAACAALAAVCTSGASAARAADAEIPAAAPPIPYESERKPRPPPSVPQQGPAVPWERHMEVGPDIGVVLQPASKNGDGLESGVRYQPALGIGAHVTWELFRYLRLSVYFLDSNHAIRFSPGALGVAGTITSDAVHTYALGARFAPTLPITSRFRAWVSAGVGWSRWQFPKMRVAETPSRSFVIYDRADSMAQFPLGLGAAFDVIPRWLSVHLEFSGAFAAGQQGSATSNAQAVDAEGRKRNIGGLPLLDGSISQTLGVSLLL